MANVRFRDALPYVSALFSAFLMAAREWNVIFVDQAVYVMAGASLKHGQDNLYELRTADGLPFTYPPFSALVFVPLDGLPQPVVARAFLMVSLVCFLRCCVLAGRSLKWRPSSAYLIFAIGLWSEPIVATFDWGQVNLVLMWLVLEDTVGVASNRRWQGVLTGIATGIKLTPGIFFLQFVARRQFRTASMLLATVLASVCLGFVLAPRSALTFFSGTGLNVTRVGDPVWPANASVNGVLWLLLGEGALTRLVWLVVAVGIVIIYMKTMNAHGRNAEVLHLTVVTGMMGALISPITWQHHWVWGLLAAVALIADKMACPKWRSPVVLIGLWIVCLYAWVAVSLVAFVGGLGPAPLVIPLGSLAPALLTLWWWRRNARVLSQL